MTKIVAINGSPRSGWNTDMLVDEAAKGAGSAGAEVVKYDLYKLEKFTGCISCFGCKREAHRGECVCKDGLKPVLDSIKDADGLIMGAPNYFGDLCAEFKLFYERLVFPYLTYNKENPCCNGRRIPVLLIMTSNAPDDMYSGVVDNYRNTLDRFIGPTSTFVSGETLQVKDYSKFDWTFFDPQQRYERREKVFPLEKKKAFDMGASLVPRRWFLPPTINSVGDDNMAMKAIVINGSPRKKWNTAQAIDKAAEGLRDSGFEVERIDLYDYTFKGCTSCFACKLKDAKTDGVCAMKDELRPVLEKLRGADAVILGSPVYFSQPLGQVRAFVERWLFPIYSYHYENGKPRVCRDKVIPCGMIYTMNLTEEMYGSWGYADALRHTSESMDLIMGYCETLNILNTYQFKDYSRYDITLFDEKEKRAYRDSHFEGDLQKAYELGCRIAEKAKQETD